eukprot:g28547.t1
MLMMLKRRARSLPGPTRPKPYCLARARPARPARPARLGGRTQSLGWKRGQRLRAHVNYPPPAEYLLPDDTAVTGQLVQQLAANLRGGLKFITQTAHVLFPSYVKSEEFQEKLWRTLMTLNAYSRD